MDLPSKVIVFSPDMEIRNKPATLLSVSAHGYYELLMEFSGRRHTVLAPIGRTGLIFNEPVAEFEASPDVER
jgi:hypothetical protein